MRTMKIQFACPPRFFFSGFRPTRIQLSNRVVTCDV